MCLCSIESSLHSQGLPVRTKKIMDKRSLIVIKCLCGGISVTFICGWSLERFG